MLEKVSFGCTPALTRKASFRGDDQQTQQQTGTGANGASQAGTEANGASQADAGANGTSQAGGQTNPQEANQDQYLGGQQNQTQDTNNQANTTTTEGTQNQDQTSGTSDQQNGQPQGAPEQGKGGPMAMLKNPLVLGGLAAAAGLGAFIILKKPPKFLSGILGGAKGKASEVTKSDPQKTLDNIFGKK